jgi:hypothetical protein
LQRNLRKKVLRYVLARPNIDFVKKAGTWVALVVVAAALLAALFFHRQNKLLIQQLEVNRQENMRLESLQPATSSQTPSFADTDKTAEVESELLRLRGAAARAARAEAENAELKRELAHARSPGTGATVASSQNNDSLTAYLGSRVDSPANLDARYTQEGLASAIQVAAQKAGISLRRVNIDDSEFPFLIGVATEPGDWPKLTEQLKTLPGYEFHGSVGDDTSHTLCTVPVRAYPSESAQNITRRMGARLELFYHSFSASQN